MYTVGGARVEVFDLYKVFIPNNATPIEFLSDLQSRKIHSESVLVYLISLGSFKIWA
jgi:hypothetical protein